MNNSSGSTARWLFGKCNFSTHESRSDVFLFIAITITTIFGNVIVFVCYSRYRALRTTTNVFLLSLSASDILVAVISIPFTFAMYLCELRPVDQHEDQIRDFVYLLCDMLPSIASIYSLTLVAVDKAIAVTNPFSYKAYVDQKSATIAVAVMWIFVASIVSLILILEKEHFTLFIIFMSYVLPVTIMVISYIVMGYIAKKHAKAINEWERISVRLNRTPQKSPVKTPNGSSSPTQPEDKTANGSSSPTAEILLPEDLDHDIDNERWHARHRVKFLWREFKAAVTLLLLLAVFVTAWTPFMSLNIEHYRCPYCHIDLRLVKYFKMLHYLNSAVNPLLYVLLSKRWRSAFWGVLCGRSSDGSAYENTITENYEW